MTEKVGCYADGIRYNRLEFRFTVDEPCTLGCRKAATNKYQAGCRADEFPHVIIPRLNGLLTKWRGELDSCLG